MHPAFLVVDTGATNLALRQDVIDLLRLPQSEDDWSILTASQATTVKPYFLDALAVIDFRLESLFALPIWGIEGIPVAVFPSATKPDDDPFPGIAGVLGWLPYFQRICVDRDNVEYTWE